MENYNTLYYKPKVKIWTSCKRITATTKTFVLATTITIHHKNLRWQDMEARTASVTTTTVDQLPLPTMTTIMTTASTMILRMLIQAWWLDKLFNIVKPQEVDRKNNSQTLMRDITSSNSMRWRRRLNCAETLRCTVAANMVTHAHMPTDPINSKRKHIFQVILWQKCARNSIEMVLANMEKDVNTYTVHMISRLSWHIHKLSRKVLDLLSKETIRLAMTLMLSASGPTWRLVMGVEHQRSHASLALNKSIIRSLFMRT